MFYIYILRALLLKSKFLQSIWLYDYVNFAHMKLIYYFYLNLSFASLFVLSSLSYIFIFLWYFSFISDLYFTACYKNNFNNLNNLNNKNNNTNKIIEILKIIKSKINIILHLDFLLGHTTTDFLFWWTIFPWWYFLLFSWSTGFSYQWCPWSYRPARGGSSTRFHSTSCPSSAEQSAFPFWPLTSGSTWFWLQFASTLNSSSFCRILP